MNRDAYKAMGDRVARRVDDLWARIEDAQFKALVEKLVTMCTTLEKQAATLQAEQRLQRLEDKVTVLLLERDVRNDRFGTFRRRFLKIQTDNRCRCATRPFDVCFVTTDEQLEDVRRSIFGTSGNATRPEKEDLLAVEPGLYVQLAQLAELLTDATQVALFFKCRTEQVLAEGAIRRLQKTLATLIDEASVPLRIGRNGPQRPRSRQ